MKKPNLTKHLEYQTLEDAIPLMCKPDNKKQNKLYECIISEIMIKSNAEELSPKVLKKLNECFNKKFAIISSFGDKMNYLIYWTSHKIQQFACLKVHNTNSFFDVKIIAEFVVDFLINSLKEKNSGIIDSEYKNKQLSLLSIGDSSNRNLLLVAAKNGNENIVDYLLKYGIKAELLESETTAQSLALQNGHYDVLLKLLNYNLTYPKNIILNECPEKLKQFIETGETFHKMIKEGNKQKLDELIKQNPNLHYFYNLSNQSALKVAADLGLVDIVEFLCSKNLLFAPHEDTNEIRNKLKFSNEQIIPDRHINILMANTLLVNVETNDEIQKRKLILQSFNTLNSDPRLKIILQIVAATKFFRIIFDFKIDSTRRIESAVVPGALGSTFTSGIITIGARVLLNKENKNEILQVLIHELCHYAMLLIYENNFNPFRNRDRKAKREFQEIFKFCKEFKEKDSVILSVYNDYQEENQLSELIVRPAHLIAKYMFNPTKLKIAINLFNKLFEYYHDIIIYEMQKALPMIEMRLIFNPEYTLALPERCDQNNKEAVYSQDYTSQKYKKVVKTSSKTHQDENKLKYLENPGCSHHDPKIIKAAAESSTETESDDDNRCDVSQTARCCTSTKIRRNNNIKPQSWEKVLFNKEIKSEKSLATEDEEPIYYFKLIFKDQSLTKYIYDIFDLPDDVFIQIFESFSNDELLNLIFTSQRFADLFERSRAIMKTFTLFIDICSYNKLSKHSQLLSLPMININLDLEGVSSTGWPLVFFKSFKESVENLIIKNAKFKNFNNFFETICNLKSIKSIILQNCSIDNIDNKVLPQIVTLKSISFNKCNENVFKTFMSQNSICKFTIRNDDWTWVGFPHEIFNLMAKNSKNLDEIELIGDGTGSFFDSDDFLFRVRKLVTTTITFHWYVGIKTERVSFLTSQKGYLKDLTIHKLPFDFDGGRVLKFIIEQMDLETFYYGNIPLILNGRKQDVTAFEANEIQIQSAFEMFRQFPSITTFRLVLSVTDISSDDIERIINEETNLFNRLEIFELEDNSKYRSIFGVFLGLMKNLRNIRKLSLKTQDRNINTLLGELLPHMNQLEEIYLSSTVSGETERFEIIKVNVPNLIKISVPVQHVSEAKIIFGSNVAVYEI